MRQRRRDHDDVRFPGSPGEEPGGEGLANIHQDGERLLNAGDEAIRNALSANSAAFLRHSRQEGGQ